MSAPKKAGIKVTVTPGTRVPGSLKLTVRHANGVEKSLDNLTPTQLEETLQFPQFKSAKVDFRL